MKYLDIYRQKINMIDEKRRVEKEGENAEKFPRKEEIFRGYALFYILKS